MYGDHTESGNRQHYLSGLRQRRIYIEDKKFLSDTFNPKEFLIMSTDFNRTIMSAYSEIKGLYPFYTSKNLTANEKFQAIPPFAFIGKPYSKLTKLLLTTLLKIRNQWLF